MFTPQCDNSYKYVLDILYIFICNWKKLNIQSDVAQKTRWYKIIKFKTTGTIWTYPNNFLKKPLSRIKFCKKNSIKQSFLVKFKNKLIIKTKNFH